MANRSEFQDKQYVFAAHIRDPETNPAPEGIEDRRMGIYRSLFFNNLHNLLGNTFPVLKKIHSPESWKRLIRLFMIHHQAQTPYFLRIPSEFVEFVQSDYPGKEEDFPFLAELAHYEWVELELSVSTEENDMGRIDPEGDYLAGVPVKSRLSRIVGYQFPVQHISKEFLPNEPAELPTYIALYRDDDDELGFMELNPVTARLLQLIDENDQGKSGKDLLLALAVEMNYPDPESLFQHGLEAMQQMHASAILLGTVKN
jgi:hypothetical protein